MTIRYSAARWLALPLVLALAVATTGAPADTAGRDADDDLAHPSFRASLRCAEFSELRMTLERNATDGDTEVVLFAKGQDEGLKRLVVTAPDGRRVANVKGDGSGIGLREFSLESAEPPDLALVLASFPSGDYYFFGRTVAGKCLAGSAPLSHRIASASAFLTPAPGQVVAVSDLVLSWTPVGGVERYVVELNNEETGAEMRFDVFPPTTRLLIPPQFVARGSEYQFAVGAKATDGNIALRGVDVLHGALKRRQARSEQPGRFAAALAVLAAWPCTWRSRFVPSRHVGSAARAGDVRVGADRTRLVGMGRLVQGTRRPARRTDGADARIRRGPGPGQRWRRRSEARSLIDGLGATMRSQFER